MKKFLKSLFSKNGTISSKRVFGGLGLVSLVVFVFVVKIAGEMQISANDVDVIKFLALVFGVLVAGDSVTDIWKQKTIQ
jgi:TfoX/Sxy family transcriptional regulator of competence genes